MHGEPSVGSRIVLREQFLREGQVEAQVLLVAAKVLCVPETDMAPVGIQGNSKASAALSGIRQF